MSQQLQEAILSLRIGFLTAKLEHDFFLPAVKRKQIEDELIILIEYRETLRQILYLDE